MNDRMTLSSLRPVTPPLGARPDRKREPAAFASGRGPKKTSSAQARRKTPDGSANRMNSYGSSYRTGTGQRKKSRVSSRRTKAMMAKPGLNMRKIGVILSQFGLIILSLLKLALVAVLRPVVIGLDRFFKSRFYRRNRTLVNRTALILTAVLLVTAATAIIASHTGNIAEKTDVKTSEQQETETATGVNPPEISIGDFYILTGAEASASDIITGAITDDTGSCRIKVAGRCNTAKKGDYHFAVRAKDTDGNVLEKEINVTVADASELPENCTFVTKTGFIGTRINGVTRVEDLIIANKTYSLPESYGKGLTKETKKAFSAMQQDAAKEGIDLMIVSGFRSYKTQEGLFKNYKAKDGDTAETYSAKPGHSEHQIGEAMDINMVSRSFADTPECKWLNENAYKYGFILRYPEDKMDITGYIWEPWHYRYAGKELAEKLYNGGDWITVEEYYGIDSVYADTE